MWGGKEQRSMLETQKASFPILHTYTNTNIPSFTYSHINDTNMNTEKVNKVQKTETVWTAETHFLR